jgi:hypothetical protein
MKFSPCRMYALVLCLLVPLIAMADEPAVLKTQIVIDTQGAGGEAFRLLVPKGWRFEGGLTWDRQRFPPEAFSSYTVTGPGGASIFQQFPHVTLFWSEDAMLQQSYAQNGFQVLPPLTAEQALREHYLSNYRPEAFSAYPTWRAK